MTPDQATFMRNIPDASLRETIRDFYTNQQFRRDYWLRGSRNLVGHEQVALLREERVVLSTARADLPTKVRGSLGEAGLVEQIYHPIYDALQDYKPRTIGDLEADVASKGVNLQQLISAVTILYGLGSLQAVAPGQDLSKAKTRTQALNRAVAKRSISVGDVAYLASPVLGGGVSAPRFQQLFWLSKQNGGKTPDDWAAFAWALLQGQNQAIIKDGATLQGDANLVELKNQAEVWGARVLPAWTALGI